MVSYIPYAPLQLSEHIITHHHHPRPKNRPLSKGHHPHHRRSRSFSALTSFISPALHTINEQPWRSRDAWAAIHGRPPSPLPVTTIPSAKGGAEGGWRRKGGGGFFARDLAGVGDAVLSLPQQQSTVRSGIQKYQTMIEGVKEKEMERYENLSSRSERVVGPMGMVEELHFPTPTIRTPEAVAQTHEWKPGFASTLFRKKTQRVNPFEPITPPDEDEVVATTPMMSSRPESLLIPRSPPPSTPHIPPPPSYRRPARPTTSSTATTDPSRVTSTCSASIRTSQSSSIHTCDSHENDFHLGSVIQHPMLHQASIRSSQYFSPRSSSLVISSSDTMDSLPKRLSSLISHMEDPPTIVTPTTTYYHFSPGRSLRVRRLTSERRISNNRSLANPVPEPLPIPKIEIAPDHRRTQTPRNQTRRPIRGPPVSPLYPQSVSPSNRSSTTTLPYYYPNQEDILPALLPSPSFTNRSRRDERDSRSPMPSPAQERMRGVIWAKPQRVDLKVKEEEEQYISGIREGEEQSRPTRRILIERVKQMDDEFHGLRITEDRRQGGKRWSRESGGTQRGSMARETMRGGWI